MPDIILNVIDKWGRYQYVRVPPVGWRYSPFYGERVLYRIRIRTKEKTGLHWRDLTPVPRFRRRYEKGADQ
jgi:hypothetical protein